MGLSSFFLSLIGKQQVAPDLGQPNQQNRQTPQPGQDNNSKKELLDLPARIIARTCLFVLAAGVVIVMLFLNTLSGKATIFVWMLACLLFGIFIGFLFGIPKILQTGSQTSPSTNTNPEKNTSTASPATTPSIPTYQQQVNTNLTEISDWLTKIIVGLGLVNLTKVPEYLRRIANIPAKALVLKSGIGLDVALAFSYGTIVTYTILGFLFGYIITRILLAILFLDADRRSLALDNINSKITEVSAAVSSANQKAELALASSTTETPPVPVDNGGPADQADPLNNLIRQYNDTRHNMPRGDARTTVMIGLFSQMLKVVSSVPNFDIAAALLDKDNAGRRLAAYAALYIKPDLIFFDPLIDALVSEPAAYNQYNAIRALKQLQSLQPNANLSPTQFAKLKACYDSLGAYENRKYELEKLYPRLKTPSSFNS